MSNSKDMSLEIWTPDRAGEYQKKMKEGPVYGPISSRREGSSLGINPIQGGFACNWDCVYCQYGEEDISQIREGKGKIRFTRLEEIEGGLVERLNSGEHFDALSICGPTEPTLHPGINDVIYLVNTMRDKYNPSLKTVLFTNTAKIMDTDTTGLDQVLMKLDAGNPETFNRISRPRGMTYDVLMGNLINAPVKEKIIQSMIVGGKDGNYNIQDVSDYIERLKEINPQEVQLYTLMYSHDHSSGIEIENIKKGELQNLATRIKREVGCEAQAFIDPVEPGEEVRF
tara:strand:+ start:346 stop:1197 length:852 start_codon:yes stop_codon:yes gene_type:complete